MPTIGRCDCQNKMIQSGKSEWPTVACPSGARHDLSNRQELLSCGSRRQPSQTRKLAFKRALTATIAALALSGCAVNSGVVPIGQDTFTVSRQAASGFSNISGLTPDALNEAKQ